GHCQDHPGGRRRVRGSHPASARPVASPPAELAERLRAGIAGQGEGGVRVVLVCPYSLSLPGGVQGQVLGLARTLRQRGVSATVLGPCDGPPPEPGVISVGSSVSLAANGSVAPLAPDPPAIRRTLEVLAAEQPDVLHLHEPLVPGPALPALLAGNVPAVGTFHASGRVPAYVWLRPGVRAVARRIGLRTAVSPEARALSERW